MQVTETNSNGLKRDFKIVIPAGDIATRVDSRLGEIAKTVKIPGFRPGKVPQQIVRQRYGEAVNGEVLEALVNESVGAMLSERQLTPALQPKVDLTDYEKDKDLEFTVSMEVLPEITAMDLSTLSLERVVAKVPEEDIDEAIQRFAEHRENTTEVKRAAKSGDVVTIDFVGKKDGVAFEGGSANGYDLKLGSGSFIPGFEDQLIGKKAGNTAVVKVTFPEGYGNAELAGQPAEFDVTVHAVKETSPAEINDELAKVLGMDDLPALREAVRGELSRELDNLSRMTIKRKLLDALAEAHDFEVPEGLVDHEFNGIWQQFEQEKARGNLDPEDAGKDEDTLKAEYRALAVRRVRLGLLMADIGKKNNLTISQEDLNRALMEEARRFPGQEHMVFQYFQKNPQALDSLRAPIFEEKVVDFILGQAKVTEKEVSAAELKADDGSEDAEKAVKSAAKKTTRKKKTAAKSEETAE